MLGSEARLTLLTSAESSVVLLSPSNAIMSRADLHTVPEAGGGIDSKATTWCV
jgi:hypothetical protein